MNINDLSNIHKGRSIWIIGKGPSLKYLTADRIPVDDVVLCLNDSIRVVQAFELSNPLYSLQKDGDSKYMVRPEDENIVLLLQGVSDSSHYSARYYPDYPKRVVLDPVTELGFMHVETTATVMAIAIAKMMGCEFIHMTCCDMLTTGDTRTIDTKTLLPELDSYKSAIYSYAKDEVLKDLKSISHDFVIPTEKKI